MLPILSTLAKVVLAIPASAPWAKNNKKLWKIGKKQNVLCMSYLVTSDLTCNGVGAFWCQFSPQTVRYRLYPHFITSRAFEIVSIVIETSIAIAS